MIDWLKHHDLEVLFFTLCPALFALGVAAGIAGASGSSSRAAWLFAGIALVLLIPSFIVLVPDTISRMKTRRHA